MPLNRTWLVGTPSDASRAAYASPSSRNGSNSVVIIIVGGDAATTLARAFDHAQQAGIPGRIGADGARGTQGHVAAAGATMSLDAGVAQSERKLGDLFARRAKDDLAVFGPQRRVVTVGRPVRKKK